MNEELDIKQIGKYIYKRMNIFIYILLIAIVLGTFYTFIIKKPTYQVNAQILIDRSDASIEDFIVSKDVLNNSDITVTFDKTSKLITISTIKLNAEEAFNITNTYIENIETKLEETYGIKTFKMIQTPQLPEKANNINYIKDISIFVLGGIIIYVVYIMIMINLRGNITNSEIEDKGIKVLGRINAEKVKNKKEVNLYSTKNKEIINQLKRIEANIELNKENRKPKTVLFTGASKKVGTSYIVNNLANQYSKLYKKVLIIDTDIFSKTLTKVYGKNQLNGLTNILEENKIEEIEKLIQTTEKENIYILPIGNENIEEDIFLKDTISNIINELTKKYDLILIDAPSINEKVLTINLASIVDAVAIVLQNEKTSQEEIIKAKATIENVGGKISGVIINKS